MLIFISDIIRWARRYSDRKVFAYEALSAVLENFDFDTVLDIGSGGGVHKKVFESAGKRVVAVDFGRSVYYEGDSFQKDVIMGDYLEVVLSEKFDLVWASHVLEHQLNPHDFLKKVHRDLKEGGVLALTVPPHSGQIVGGHVSMWNAGLLLYHLVLAGFDCKDVSIKRYRYNISVILKKSTIQLPELDYDFGDVDRLKPFLPAFAQERFNGDIRKYNWPF